MTQRLADASSGYRRQERANLQWATGATAAWQIQPLHSTVRYSVGRRRSGQQLGWPVSATDLSKRCHRPCRMIHDTKHNSQRRALHRGSPPPVSRSDPTQDAERVRLRCILPSWRSERQEEWLWRKACSPSPYPISRTGRWTLTPVGQNRKVVERVREIGDRPTSPSPPVWAD